MTAKVVYGCVVGSFNRLIEYVQPHTMTRQLVSMWRAPSIAVGYNAILDAYSGRDFDALVLLHDDLALVDARGEEKLLEALASSDVAVVGVAGARRPKSLAWWEAETIGHQLINTGLIDFGDRSGDVDVLEGSLMAFSRAATRNLRFDEGYTGFHGYDCDITMTARSSGKRVVVADVDTHHHTSIGFKSAEQERAWRDADQRFREKWGL